MIITTNIFCQRRCLLFSVEEISSLNSFSGITLKNSLYFKSSTSKLSKFELETPILPATIKLQLFFFSTLNSSSNEAPGGK